MNRTRVLILAVAVAALGVFVFAFALPYSDGRDRGDAVHQASPPTTRYPVVNGWTKEDVKDLAFNLGQNKTFTLVPPYRECLLEYTEENFTPDEWNQLDKQDQFGQYKWWRQIAPLGGPGPCEDAVPR